MNSLELYIADHLDNISTAEKLIDIANSRSVSALSTFVYAAQLIINSGFIKLIFNSKLFKSEISNSFMSVKIQLCSG